MQVWNDIGVVIQYNSEDEQSITVEFHDTATHHAIHVSNTLSHVLADLSTSAVLLACEADDKNPRYTALRYNLESCMGTHFLPVPALVVTIPAPFLHHLGLQILTPSPQQSSPSPYRPCILLCPCPQLQLIVQYLHDFFYFSLFHVIKKLEDTLSCSTSSNQSVDKIWRMIRSLLLDKISI